MVKAETLFSQDEILINATLTEGTLVASNLISMSQVFSFGQSPAEANILLLYQDVEPKKRRVEITWL